MVLFIDIQKMKILNIEGVTCFSWPLITKPSDYAVDNMLVVGTATGHVYSVAITTEEQDMDDIDDDDVDGDGEEETGFNMQKTCVIYNEDGRIKLIVLLKCKRSICMRN